MACEVHKYKELKYKHINTAYGLIEYQIYTQRLSTLWPFIRMLHISGFKILFICTPLTFAQCVVWRIFNKNFLPTLHLNLNATTIVFLVYIRMYIWYMYVCISCSCTAPIMLCVPFVWLFCSMPQWMSRCIAPWPHVSLRCVCAKMTFRLITGCVAWVPTQIHAFRHNDNSALQPTGYATAMYGANGQIAAAGIFHQLKRSTSKCNMQRRMHINEFQAANAAIVEPIVGCRWLLRLKLANRPKKLKYTNKIEARI